MAIKDVKQSYKPSEWLVREDYYATEVGKIVIPDAITTIEIKSIESKIDALYTEAALDMAFCRRKFETLDRMKKLTEKELFFFIKQSSATLGLKTVDDITSATVVAMKLMPAVDVIEGTGWDKNKTNIVAVLTSQPSTPIQGTTIFPALRVAEERVIFMEQIVNILKEKHSRIITLEGALKLEVGISVSN